MNEPNISELEQPALFPVEVIRTETVISRLPIHNLAKKGEIEIKIETFDPQGKRTLQWEVEPGKAGHPRQLAYKLDSILIQQKIDEAGTQLPKRLRLGSLAEICHQLGVTVSGKTREDIKNSLKQNAGCVINAHLSYVGADNVEYTLTAYFNRYNVIFAGQKLPDGTKADAVYVTFSDEYYGVLCRAKRRPLDYGYMKELSAKPASQRFYEILSYQMFAALKSGEKRARLYYSDYITFSAQVRQTEDKAVTTQMWKVHQPHFRAGYITDVKYTRATDKQGRPDWLMSYGIGPKAIAEFETFNRNPRNREEGTGGTAAPVFKLASSAAEGSATNETALLVELFLQRRYGKAARAANAKELEAARQLLDSYGAEGARFILEYSLAQAVKENFQVRYLHGLAGYFGEAAQVYQVRQPRAGNSTASEEQPLADIPTFLQQQFADEQAQLARAEAQLQQLSPAEYEAHRTAVVQAIKARIGDKFESEWDDATRENTIRAGVLRRLQDEA